MATLTADAPLVSVCIPTYKGVSTLGPAIASVLAQTQSDLELIVIDDCSPDDTAAVVSGFRDHRLRYVRNDRNLGAEGSWNRCLDEARGRYFKLLPHDDLLAPDCLAQQVAVLEADVSQDVALVFSAREVIGPDGRVLMRRGCAGAAGGRLPALELLRQCVRRGTNLIGEPGAVLMRRALTQQVGHFDARYPYLIDMDYWFRLLGHGDAFYIDAALASFRVSASQWSVALSRQQSQDFHGCVLRHRSALASTLSLTDRALAAVTPRLNALARQVFYRLYLK